MRAVVFFSSLFTDGNEVGSLSVFVIIVSTLDEITELAARIKLNGLETATSFPISKYITVPLFCSRIKFILSFTQSTPLNVYVEPDIVASFKSVAKSGLAATIFLYPDTTLPVVAVVGYDMPIFSLGNPHLMKLLYDET